MGRRSLACPWSRTDDDCSQKSKAAAACAQPLRSPQISPKVPAQPHCRHITIKSVSSVKSTPSQAKQPRKQSKSTELNDLRRALHMLGGRMSSRVHGLGNTEQEPAPYRGWHPVSVLSSWRAECSVLAERALAASVSALESTTINITTTPTLHGTSQKAPCTASSGGSTGSSSAVTGVRSGSTPLGGTIERRPQFSVASYNILAGECGVDGDSKKVWAPAAGRSSILVQTQRCLHSPTRNPPNADKYAMQYRHFLYAEVSVRILIKALQFNTRLPPPHRPQQVDSTPLPATPSHTHASLHPTPSPRTRHPGRATGRPRPPQLAPPVRSDRAGTGRAAARCDLPAGGGSVPRSEAGAGAPGVRALGVGGVRLHGSGRFVACSR